MKQLGLFNLSSKLKLPMILLAVLIIFSLLSVIPDSKEDSIKAATIEIITGSQPDLEPNLKETLPRAEKKILGTQTKQIYLPILMYHHVGDLAADANPLDRDLTVSSREFESQVKYFKAKGFESVTMSQAYEGIALSRPLPQKPIIFTFDDGFQDVFLNAVPILEKHGYVGIFAISTDLLGRPGYAVWNDVLIADQKGMEIVSHSMNHLDLTYSIYTDEDLTREIYGSKKQLEDKLNHKVEFFVYPYGEFNDKVVGMVGDAGYKMALTTQFGEWVNPENFLLTPRVRVHGYDGLAKLQKIFEPAQR